MDGETAISVDAAGLTAPALLRTDEATDKRQRIRWRWG